MLVLTSAFALASVPAAWTQERAYVPNFKDDTVSVIDTATNTVVATVNVGSGPFDAAVSPTGAYVTSQFSVSVIDTGNNTVIATLGVEDPPLLGVALDGHHAYVVNSTVPIGSVLVIDTSTNTVTASITVGENPIGIAVDGSRAYVTNRGASGSVSVIDTSTLAVIATISVGDAPWGVAVGATRAYVVNSTFPVGTVSVIDTATNTVIDTVNVGSQPWGVAVAAQTDGPVYVTNYGASPQGTVSVIDAGTNTVTATIPVGFLPTGVAFAGDRSRVYVTNAESEFRMPFAGRVDRIEQEDNLIPGTVSVIDTALNTVVATLTVGTFAVAIGDFVGVGPIVFADGFETGDASRWQ